MGSVMDVVLAFETGGSRTRLGVYRLDETLLRQSESGPGNPFDVGVERCLATMVELTGKTLAEDEHAVEACAAVAGAGLGAVDALAQGLCRRLNLTRAAVTGDLYPILLANAGTRDAVLAVAGTGSSVMAQRADGAFATVGGRGNLFGDRGSAYAIAAAGLRAAAEACDGLGPATTLTHALARAAGVAKFTELVMWGRHAAKADVAALCPAVTGLVDSDEVAKRVVAVEARAHADQALAGARKLELHSKVPILGYGGVFDGCPAFFSFFKERIREQGHQGDVTIPEIHGHAAVLQIRHAPSAPALVTTATSSGAARLASCNQAKQPTEEAMAADRTLDAMDPEAIIAAMGDEDTRAVQAVQAQRAALATVIRMAAHAIHDGGRIIYVGAGTSGRLGVLDASECPPTFGVAPTRVCALIAGGDRALRESIEGAEDDTGQGQHDIASFAPAIGPEDLVIGIAASGTTPYTRAALQAAGAAGAKTVLLCCNPQITSGAGLIVALDTGPEVLAGSTRLKAGTATKLALNMISTGAMALSGYVYRGLMVGVKPSNAKLWRRATGIVATLANCSTAHADRLLQTAEGCVAVAVLMHEHKLSTEAAAQRLRDHGGILRDALETSHHVPSTNNE
jgi:N-acetylmuramic acid 6-phosphate etherase